MCLIVAKLAGAWSVRTRHSSSRKTHVQDPVQAVLDGPVTADDRTQQVRQQHQRCEVEACLLLDFSGDLSRALNHDHRLEARPVVPFLQPGNIVDDSGGPGLDTAMIAVDRLITADLGILKACCLLLGDKQLNVLAQRALIALQREHVIGFLVHDLLCDVALATHGIDGHDRTLDRQHVQQFGNSDDLVGLFRDLHLTQHEPLAGCEGRNHVDRRDAVLLSARPPRGLAINGNHPVRRSGQCSDPGDKASLELLGLEHCQDVAEMIVCWRAVLEWTEAAQKLALLATEQGDVDKGFRPGEHREQTEKEDLADRVGYLALLARALQVFEIAQKNNRLVECGTIRRRVVHGCPPLSEPRRPMDSALYRVVTYSFTRLPWGSRPPKPSGYAPVSQPERPSSATAGSGFSALRGSRASSTSATSPAPVAPPPDTPPSTGQIPCSPTSKTASWPRTAPSRPNMCRATSAPSPGASTAASS